MEAVKSSSALELSYESARAIRRHARGLLPQEACGVLLGRASGPRLRVIEARPAANVAMERRYGYLVDPEDLAVGLFAARRRGLELIGFYHSHPGGVAWPSARDEVEAWPGVSYVLVSVPAVGPPVLRSYRRGCRGRLAEEEVVIGDGGSARE